MKISQLSIKRPVTTLMAVFIILILGFVSLTRLNIDLLPDINLPYAVVSTTYNGAGPEEVENIVTKNLENVLAAVDDLKSMQSVSSEQNSLVILEFNSDADMDFAMLDVREKIDLIKGMLPEGVSEPVVLKYNPNVMPIMNFGLSQTGKSVSELNEWTDDILKPRIERLEGVAAVSISGAAVEEIKVVIDEDYIKSIGVTMSQIANALAMDNINAPGGIAKDGQYNLLLRTTGEFTNIDQIKNTPIVTQSGSTFILSDIAEVNKGTKSIDQYAKINGRDSLYISVRKESVANTAKVAARVNEEIAGLKETYPNIKIDTVVDQSEYINRSVGTVSKNAIIGGILAVIILILFLKDYRPTLVIGLSIPISIIATFIMVYFSGISLNIVSLGGLALGVGMLVDNSIVVLENIYRLRQQGYDSIEAASKGSSQVSMAITASTLTTISVFLPIVFVGGITAEIFKQLALTVTFSLIASLFVALTLVPMLSSKLISKKVNNKEGKVISNIKEFYRKVLGFSLKKRGLVIVIAVVVFLTVFPMISTLGSSYFPKMDQGSISVNVSMPSGSSFDETVQTIQKVEDYIKEIPEVNTIFTGIGSDQTGMNMNSGATDSGTITVVLNSLKNRNRGIEEIGDDIRLIQNKVAGCKLEVSTGGSFMGGGAGGMTPLVIEIKGDNLNKLKEISYDVQKIVSDVEGTREVKSGYTTGSPELKIIMDRQSASMYGLNTAIVSSSVKSYVDGMVASRYKIDGKEIDIRIQTKKAKPDIDDIKAISIMSPLGIPVALDSIAKFEYSKGPESIQRKDQVRMINVTGDIKDRSLGEIVSDIEDKLKGYNMPDGYSIEFGGEQKEMQAAFKDLAMALLLGVVLVYMIMASQFESLLHPFTIILALPLAFTGAIIGLFVAGESLSVPAVLGIIVLAGIVVNNGIVLIDYINQLRSEGLSKNDAILKAGPIRLRPILMTTMTTVLALIPLALGMGEGSEIEMPLAITVIGGLVLSAVLTLVVLPVIYSLFDDLGKRFRFKKI